MSRHRSDPGRAGAVAVSLAVFAVVAVLGGVGAYAMFRALSGSPQETAPTPVALRSTTSAAVPSLEIRVKGGTCPFKLLSGDGKTVLENKELEPGEIVSFPYEEFQGTVCTGADVFVRGERQTPTPGPDGEGGWFRS